MEVFIARQPVFDRRIKVVAYELLYRPGLTSDAGEITDPQSATAQVLQSAFDELEIGAVVGDSPALINVTRDFLLSDQLPLQHKNRIIFDLLEGEVIERALTERMQALHSQGVQFALDGFEFHEIPFFR